MKIVNIVVIGNFFENAGGKVMKGAGMTDQKMLNELNGLKMNCEKFKKD